jgi:rhodanese-related sulfurtransferase
MNLVVRFLVLLGLAVASPAAFADAPSAIAGAKTVDAEGIIALVGGQPDLVILDNRKAEDFNAGSLEGAVRLIDTDVNAETLAKHVPSKTAPVLFYCKGLNCGRAAKAVETALSHGYTNVYYYALGMDEWNRKGLPVVKR